MKTKKLIIIIASAVLTVGLTTGILAATGVFSGGNGGGIQGPLTAEQVYAQAQDLGFEGSLEDFLALCKGEKGDPGQDGKDGQNGTSITSIEKTSTTDNVDTYTITLSDGQSYTFTVTNGTDGQNGKDGADGKDGVDGKDGEDGEDGADGKDGEDGTSITSIEKTSSSGYVDTYTITLSDGQSYTFTVTNGKDGQNGTNGTNGENGKTVEFRVDGTWVQWKYTDEAEADWKNLYETTGTPAPDGLVRLSFSLDGGAMPTGTPDHIDVTSGIYVTLPTPTKSGYTFTGWYLSGGTKPLTSPYRVHESQRLYARWEAGAIITGKKIYNIDDLVAVNDNLGGTYVLMNDINCDGNAITIGTDESNAFRGIFEGQGHKIYNYNASQSKYIGLFGYITGTVRNLQVADFDFEILSTTSDKIYVGGLVGYNAGTVQKCSATNGSINVNISANSVCGLLIGENKGPVSNCYTEGYVKAVAPFADLNVFAGGVSGSNSSTITNCYSIATLYSFGEYYRGYRGNSGIITGINEGIATISNCLSFGTIIEGNNTRGDVCGRYYGTITNCYKDENLVISNPTSSLATAMSKAQLSSATFYRISLKWDATVWNYSNINFDNGIYPTLIYNF